LLFHNPHLIAYHPTSWPDGERVALGNDDDDDEDGHALIDRLIRLAEEDTSDADWRTLARSVNKGNPTISERHDRQLRAIQAMRDAGVLDEIEAHFLISQFVDFIVAHRVMIERSSPALNALSDGSEEADVDAEFDRIWDEITAATFEEYGEPELATMHRFDRQKFDDRCDEGEKKFRRRKRGRQQ
jgi:hypothetical protein